MARKQKHEEHVNHERWLVSYADFITLLFAFFVVMYAISSVNQGKYRVLSDALVAAFRSAPKTMEPIQVGEPSKSPASPTPNVRDKPAVIQPPRPPLPRPLSPFPPDTPKGRKPLPESQGKEAAPRGTVQQQAPSDQGETAVPIQEIARQIKEALGELQEAKLIEVRSEPQRVEIELKASILFGSGSARVQPEAMPVLERIAAILTPFPNSIEVSGYTDNDPIRSFVFPSNWELSAARAASVVHLFADSGVRPERMAAIGYGEYQPVTGNDTAEGRSKNRRVILAILAEPDQAPDLQEFKPEPKPVQVANQPEQAPAAPLSSIGETAAPAAATASLLMLNKLTPAPVAPPAELPGWLKLSEPAGAAAPSPELLKPSTSYGEMQGQTNLVPAVTPPIILPARSQLPAATSVSPIAPITPIVQPRAPVELSREPKSVKPVFPQRIAPPIQLPFGNGLVRPPIAIGIAKPGATSTPAPEAAK